jgi:hypothetical protein
VPILRDEVGLTSKHVAEVARELVGDRGVRHDRDLRNGSHSTSELSVVN